MDNVFVCEVCSITMQSGVAEAHIQGKKHRAALRKKCVVEKKQQCGVFVTNFSNSIKSEDVFRYFAKFGPITYNKFGENNRFLLLDYAEPTVAQHVLNLKHQLHNRNLIVRPRVLKTRPDKKQPAPTDIDDFTTINSKLTNIPNLDDQIKTLLTQIQPDVNAAYSKYTRLCNDLETTLRLGFPDCKVHPFGSTITGLCFKNSDIDVYVELSRDDPCASDTSPSLKINRSKKLLYKSRLFTNVIGIPHARTPIVKCVHLSTRLNCDFNFKGGLGVANTGLLRFYLQLDPKLMAFVMTLKYWAKVLEVSGMNRFSNYALVLMVVFYLQQEPYLLPAVRALQTDDENENGKKWNTKFNFEHAVDTENLKKASQYELLRGFFDLYANFDYTLHVICPYLGKSVLKTDFRTSENAKNWAHTTCVQDPIERSHNVTQCVSKHQSEYFVSLCKKASEIFRQAANSHVDLLFKIFSSEVDFGAKKAFTINNDNRVQVVKLRMSAMMNYWKRTVAFEGDVEQNLRLAWFDLVQKFVFSVLVDVLKMAVTVSEGDASAEENTAKTVTFACKGRYNLWEARRSISRKRKLEMPAQSLIERESALSSYICDEMYKSGGVDQMKQIISFDLVYKARIKPTEVELTLRNVLSEKGYFKTFSVFFVSLVPQWFKVYVSELDRNECNVEKVEVVVIDSD